MKKLSYLLLGTLIALTSFSCKGKADTSTNEEVDNPLHVSKPTIQKFVVVTPDEGTAIYRQADKNSPTLVRAVEDIESDMADQTYLWSDEKVPDGYAWETDVAWPGTVYAVLGEEGDFYKVSTMSLYCDLETGYLPKSVVSDISAEPYTADVAESVDWNQTMVIKEGKNKGLVLTDICDELWGESMELGVMLDSCIAYPTGYKADCIMDNDLSELKLLEENESLSIHYPKSLMKDGAENSWEWCLGLKKLSEEQLDEVCAKLMNLRSDRVRYDFYFPALGIQSVTMKVK